MSIIYQNGKFINTLEQKLRYLENKVNNIGNSGGSGNSSISIQDHGTFDTTFTLTPNTLHKWDEVTELTLTLGAETPGIVNEYLIQFTSGTTPTIVTLPEDIKWASPLKTKANKIYQISIVNNLATYAEFNALNVPIILDLTIDDIQEIDGGGFQIVNPDMISQLQTLCDWIVANEHTGEDIDNKMAELGEPLPPEQLNILSGVIYDDGFLIINFPPEDDLPELVYGFGINAQVLNGDGYENMYLLAPNDFMNNPMPAMLDLSTGDLILQIQQ